jgi:hypothetical protein
VSSMMLVFRVHSVALASLVEGLGGQPLTDI